MWDPAGMFGWKITGPGHGFTLVNINDWQGAIASAPLSHLGFHAPLLLASNATSLPSDLDSYFTMVSPSFLNTPADGPYNMTYVLGSWDQVSWDEQVRVDTLLRDAQPPRRRQRQRQHLRRQPARRLGATNPLTAHGPGRC
jgi:hypothetical protein